jgi:predicted ester cyclase
MTPTEVVLKATESFNSHDRQGWMSFCTPDIDADRNPAADAWGAIYDAWTDAFPDGRIEVVKVADGGEYVAAEDTFTGTHTGTLRPPGGPEFEATGKRVEFDFCIFCRIVDGKLSSLHSYGAISGLMEQLGVLPAAESAPA